MGPTRVGVPVTSGAERIPSRDPPQGKSRAVNTLACCLAAQVGFSPTLPTRMAARDRHFLPPPRREREKKAYFKLNRKTANSIADSVMLSSGGLF
ncbi:hypothetical protein EVAR_10469_1 [Eumeta japonica]|uniref:Uncharacterized protein n=1 Tax=Eumeta variegata TaxID=151549 RepID=A0A4C1TJY0_EUMVA|nr:hypothetical protein EVAR_10469_1 [Eumeta japonica]